MDRERLSNIMRPFEVIKVKIYSFITLLGRVFITVGRHGYSLFEYLGSERLQVYRSKVFHYLARL